ISESFAHHNKFLPEKNQFITLETNKGEQKFEVIGIYYDYSSDRGTVLMSSNTYINYWNDESINSIAVFVKKGINSELVVEELKEKLADYNLIIQSNEALRTSAMEVFDRTFSITSAL